MSKFLKLKKLIFCIIPALLICGCSNSQPVEDDRLIILKNPVSAATNYEEAKLRNIYDTTIFSSVVSPYVEEYSFSKDQVFKSYEAVPGENVNKGDTLVYARTRNAEQQIEELDESIDNLTLNHTVETAHFNTDIDVAVDNQNKAGAWGGLERAKLNRDRLEEQYRQSNEKFYLELEHLKAKKNLVQKLSGDANITSGISGTVVNCAIVYGQEQVQKDVPLIAVGDLNRKLLKCEYISKATINKAEDIYAFINGKRYEIINESVESDEYTILKNNGETVYSTFEIIDENDEVSFGDYAVVVLLKESRSDVLCVPTDAVKRENNKAYVYVLDGENTVYTEVETGMKDDFYVEILSGVNEGDKVISNRGVKLGNKTAVLEKGECSTSGDVSGFLFYPFSQWIISPMDSGTAYIKEFFVSEYEEVKQGQKLVSVEVNQDTVEIERVENQIARVNARILDEINHQKDIDELNAKIDEPARKVVDRDIEKNLVSYQKDLVNLENKLKKLKKYTGVIDIFAPSNGIITDIGELKPGDLINKDTQILQFADVSKSFIVLKDSSGILNYGNKVDIDFANTDNSRTNVVGEVVTVSNTSLSSKMQKDWALVAVDEADKALMAGSLMNTSGKWGRSMYKVTVDSRKMDNVVLVPKSAVEMKGGATYVKIKDSNGNVSLKSFIAGGSNNSFYWVLSGLEEGTEICWD